MNLTCIGFALLWPVLLWPSSTHPIIVFLCCFCSAYAVYYSYYSAYFSSASSSSHVFASVSSHSFCPSSSDIILPLFVVVLGWELGVLGQGVLTAQNPLFFVLLEVFLWVVFLVCVLFVRISGDLFSSVCLFVRSFVCLLLFVVVLGWELGVPPTLFFFSSAFLGVFSWSHRGL